MWWNVGRGNSSILNWSPLSNFWLGKFFGFNCKNFFSGFCVWPVLVNQIWVVGKGQFYTRRGWLSDGAMLAFGRMGPALIFWDTQTVYKCRNFLVFKINSVVSGKKSILFATKTLHFSEFKKKPLLVRSCSVVRICY